MMKNTRAALKEPSTWAGLAIVMQGIGRILAHDYSAIPEVICGIVAILRKEKGTEEK